MSVKKTRLFLGENFAYAGGKTDGSEIKARSTVVAESSRGPELFESPGVKSNVSTQTTCTLCEFSRGFPLPYSPPPFRLWKSTIYIYRVQINM